MVAHHPGIVLVAHALRLGLFGNGKANFATFCGVIHQLGIVLGLLRHARLRDQNVEVVGRSDQGFVAVVEPLLQIARGLVGLCELPVSVGDG